LGSTRDMQDSDLTRTLTGLGRSRQSTQLA